MPELPEVETIARYLRDGRPGYPPVVGRRITGAELRWPRSIADPTPEKFAGQISGQTVKSIGRRGKFLRLNLSQQVLLVHLRMSGDIYPQLNTADANPHHRVILNLDQDLDLCFEDTRKFGRLWLLDDPSRVLDRLGVEPLGDEFTPQWLYAGLQARNRQLKPLLLDQQFIAGLGNIYTDEALYASQLHPLMISSQVSQSQAELLWQSIRTALNRAIQRNGTSIDWVYRGGDYQQYLQVYGRKGDPCQRCGTPVIRILVGQRGTHLCPKCQRLP
jgi:formamidopyrimidine-DNA glycosylase